MMKITIIIIASFKAEKNLTSGFPFLRSLPRTIPNTMEKTVRPIIFTPPSDITPAGTVSEPAWISILIVVMLVVPLLWTAVIFSLGPRLIDVPVTLNVSNFADNVTYFVFFWKRNMTHFKSTQSCSVPDSAYEQFIAVVG